MTAHHKLAVAIGLVCSLATAGCGLGAGPSIGRVTLTVTRDYGGDRLLQVSYGDAPESETAMRLLDRSAEITTRYGGRFVEAVNGVEGGSRDGRFFDWFFYVNGVESPVGAADYPLHGGDRVWWDYRDWSEAMRVPAVVGSFPEPLLRGYEGERHAVEVRCAGSAAGRTCAGVEGRLREAGVTSQSGEGAPIRVLVGTWGALRIEDAAELVERGPQASGVFADFEPRGDGFELELLDVTGEARRRLRAAGGLVAATRVGEDPPTWLVTGTDAAGVAAAAKLLNPSDLRDRYAVATNGSRTFRAPVP